MSSKTFLPGSVFSLFFFLPLALFAQIGIKAGPSIADIGFLKYGQTPYLGYEIDILDHRVPMLTFQAGFFSTFELSKRIDFQPELLFITQGLDYSTQYLYDDITYQVRISYTHVPLLLKYKTGLKRKWHPALIAGPYVSWKLKANKIVEAEGQREQTTMPNVRNADFGLIAGYAAGFDLPSEGNIAVELRISYSLINIMDKIDGYIPKYGESPEKAYARNISISVLVGYQFVGQ